MHKLSPKTINVPNTVGNCRLWNNGHPVESPEEKDIARGQPLNGSVEICSPWRRNIHCLCAGAAGRKSSTGNWQPIVADSGATGCIMVVKLLPTAAPPPHNAKVYTVESFLEEHSLPAECQA